MFNQEVPKAEVPKPAEAPSKDIAEAIDRNDQPSPALSIDEKSKKLSVVGDANEIKPTKGNYKLTFAYPADEVSEEDKAKMVKNADGDYVATVEYQNKRVKPLYRSKVALQLAKIMVAMDVMTTEGYSTEHLTEDATLALADHIEEMGEIARMTLGIPASQVEYMQPEDLAAFFVQLMDNEPNIMKESVGFLGLLLNSKNKGQTVAQQTTESQNTQQS